MIIYLYKWKLKSGFEQQFQDAWSYVTEELKAKCGSLGSRLHQGNDGFYYGYAQWPDGETREKANLKNPKMEAARKLMRDAVEESFPETVLEPLADFLSPPLEGREV